MVPRETTVVEILEDVNPDKNVIEACEKLSKAGYKLALDDFVFRQELKPLIELADIIKIDFRLTPISEIKELIARSEFNNIKLLAEKVETIEEFWSALDMGFSYFQGYFFSKPEIIRGKEISSTSLQLLEVIAEVNKPEYDIKRLELLISRDISISYKLLRYINSAFFRRRGEITSIKQAVFVLGKTELSRFISLIVMSQISSDKPDELIRNSCVKAKFCEGLGRVSGCGIPVAELFMLGLFSNIDAILDQPMKEIMEKLPLPQNIIDALVSGEGEAVSFLRLIEAYERGNWDKVGEYASQCRVAGDSVPQIYFEACQWANELVI
jgi:EAL and modified HD-GYP domain-containing signal transduction protein